MAQSSGRTIGVLFPGEMGAALGGLLARAGHRVVTTVAGRGPRTKSLATQAGLNLLDSVDKVVRQSDVLLSLVPPGAAVSVARQVADYQALDAARRAGSGALYIDANSISPGTARSVAAAVEAGGMRFVDAAVHGLARRLPEHGVVYFSGADSCQAMALFEGAVRTQWLGAEPGRASAMKMLMAGAAKGTVALFLELALAAREASIMDEFLVGCGRSYPDVFALAARLLPTYPRHAARRAEEMAELEQTIREFGLEPEIVSGIARLHARLAESDLRGYVQAIDDGLFETDDLVELIALDNPLRPLEMTSHASYRQ